MLPSSDTSVSSALTRRHAGLSTIAFSDECTSFDGPRPQALPSATSSSSTTPLAPRLTVTAPSASCSPIGMKTPMLFFSAAWMSGRSTSLPMLGEPISSSPSATSTRLTGIACFASRIACSAVRKAISGPFWLVAPRPTIALPSPGLSTMRRLQRRRRPFRRVELFDVVHEVQADRGRRAGIERGVHAWLAAGLDDFDVLEAGLARQLRHVLGALLGIEVFGRDRRQRDPVLQRLHRRIVALRHLRADRVAIRRGGLRDAGHHQRQCSHLPCAPPRATTRSNPMHPCDAPQQ